MLSQIEASASSHSGRKKMGVEGNPAGPQGCGGLVWSPRTLEVSLISLMVGGNRSSFNLDAVFTSIVNAKPLFV